MKYVMVAAGYCIGYLYYQDFALDSIYLCCCSWVPIKVGIKQFTFDYIASGDEGEEQ